MKGERQGAQVTLRKILSRYQEKKFTIKVIRYWNRGPERSWSLHLWKA